MPAQRPQATDAELAVLKLLWEGEPLTARAICEQLYPDGTPSDQATVQKLLQRLEHKRLVARDRRSFAHLFRATVTLEALAGNQLEALAEKLTDGSLVPFILHAVGSKQLTAEGAAKFAGCSIGDADKNKGADMANLFAIGVTNAVVATALAIVVWCVTRVCRQPPLAHVLWALVLLKLVTPPMVTIPWHLEPYASSMTGLAGRPGATATVDAVAERERLAARANLAAAERATSGTMASQPADPTAPVAEPILTAGATEQLPAAVEQRSDVKRREPMNWIALVMTAWFAGSAIWLLIAILRLVRFHGALNKTVLCSAEVCRMADKVAAKLGVTGHFRLRMTDARLSPMVWPIGRPTVVLSRPLLAELSREETETLLAHELAHLRRKDHWLRWLELLVMAAYWWHPVVWWSRHMIRKAEEQACDAWVVWAFPDSARGYASALFKAVQMVSEHRPSAPLVASRLGSAGNLKERIEDIMNARWNRRITFSARVAVMLVALVLLPISLKAVSSTDEPAVESKKTTTIIKDEKQKPDATKQDRYSAASKTKSATTQPERIRGGMRIFIAVEGTPPNKPIDAHYHVERGGTVPLGPTYGRVQLEGMTVEEAETALANHLKTMIKDPHVQITITNAPVNRRQSEERVTREELDALREHVQFLDSQFKKIDALYQTASRGGSADVRATAGYELASTQFDLALAEGQRGKAIDFGEQSVRYAEEGLQAVTASYDAGRRTHDAVLQAARNVSEAKRRLVRLREPQASTASPKERTFVDDTRPQREVAQAAASEPNSVSFWRKVAESKKQTYDRLKSLAKADEISVSELEKAKLDYEMSVAQYEHAKRNLRYAQLQVELAETEYQQAVESSKAVPNSISEYELRKLRIKVDMAKVKLSDVE